MPAKIGVLLPRSTEYPAMSFDLLDGIRIHLKQLIPGVQFFTENTGFGEDTTQTHARAEKLVLEHDVQLIIAYATSLNAEALYPFADTTGKPILFIDAGMEIFEAPPHPLCRHLTLQGLTACYYLAQQATEGGKKVISAASFLDGGYRSSWIFQKAIEEAGGTTVGHFVSHYLKEEFTIAPLLELIARSGAETVVGAFTSYLDGLFMNALREAGTPALPFYCSPFMADEQLLPSIQFPGGEFLTVAPWSLTLENDANKKFVSTIREEKNKAANIFHLLGWEAASAAVRMLEGGVTALDDWSFESPRGKVHFHPETHSAYAPLYSGKIAAGEKGECRLVIGETIDVPASTHRTIHFSRPEGQYSRWKNNFFCI